MYINWFKLLTLYWELQLYFAERWTEVGRLQKYWRPIWVCQSDILGAKVLQNQLKHMNTSADLTGAFQCACSLGGHEKLDDGD